MKRRNRPETRVWPSQPAVSAAAAVVDVVVIGGGPAGAAAAIALARAGYSVTLLERSHYDAPRIGETLPPEVRQPLLELGVWDRFLADGHLESPGIVSAWGRPELYDNDFIVNPHGPGWHVDRRLFDRTLAMAAVAAGAEVLVGVVPIACAHDSSGRRCVAARAEGANFARHASIVVDATGRSSSPAHLLRGGRIIHDRLVGLVEFTLPMGAERFPDRRTLIEATELGWWYSAPLPSGRRIAAFMTDGDLIPRRAVVRAEFRCLFTPRRLSGRMPLPFGCAEGGCTIPGFSSCIIKRVTVDPRSLFLVLQWAPPSGSPADLPLVFTYKSDSSTLTEFGYGWSGPYHRFAEPSVTLNPPPLNVNTPVYAYTYQNTGSAYATGAPGQNTLTGNSTIGWTERQPDGTTFKYFSSGVLSTIANKAGLRWTLAWDGGFNLVQAIQGPLGRRTSFAYNGSSQITRIQGPDGRITSLTVDANSNLTQVISPGLCVSTFLYDNSHHMLAWINPLGDRTSFIGESGSSTVNGV